MATLLELDDLITQISTNPLARRIRSAIRIYAQTQVRSGATQTIKDNAKDALLNTDKWLAIMMPDIAATAKGVAPPFDTITDAQITTAIASIAPTYMS